MAEPAADPNPAASGRERRAPERARGPAPKAVPDLRRPGRAGAYELLWRTGVLNLLAITRRELGAYFVSPIGYVLAALLAPLIGYIGYLAPVRLGYPVSMDLVYSDLVFFTALVIAPLLTMRLLAEERRQGTLEVILTSPVRDWELVGGKWLGALLFYVLVTAFVFVIALLLVIYQPAHQVLHPFGLTISVGNLDLGPVLSGYLGMLLAAAAFLAVGLLFSSLTQNQIIAAAGTFVTLVILDVALGFGDFAEPPVSDVLGYLAAGTHLTSFSHGQLVLKDAVYFLTLVAGPLFIATRVLESRRWR